MKIQKRIELLEEALLPVDEGPPQIMHLHFVDADMKVVNTLEYKLPSLPPPTGKRRWSRWRPRG